MYNENNSHLELIEKNGTVKIPSIFMFENNRNLTDFLDRSREANCTVIFENENIKVLPNVDDGVAGSILAMYKPMIDNRGVGNAYLRYLGNIDKMRWDKVK